MNQWHTTAVSFIQMKTNLGNKKQNQNSVAYSIFTFLRSCWCSPCNLNCMDYGTYVEEMITCTQFLVGWTEHKMCQQGPTCTGIKLKTIMSQMIKKNIHDAAVVQSLDDVRGEFCGEFHMYMRFHTPWG